MHRLTTTMAYISKVEQADRERAGHHRYVVEQQVLNLNTPLDQLTSFKVECFDRYIEGMLKRLDVPVERR